MIKRIARFKFPIKILISIGIMALLFQRMDGAELRHALENISFLTWTGAALLLLAQLCLLSLRWQDLINVGRRRMSYPVSLQVCLASNIANLLLIATVSGMIVRVAVALQFGASLFKALFATAIDRMMTLASLALLCAVFLPSLAPYVENHSYKNISIFVGISIIVIFIITPILVLKFSNKLPEKLISKGNMRSGIRYLTLLFNNNALLARILITSLVAQICFFIAIYLITVSIGIELSFLQMMIVLPAISIVSSIPLSFGGWGVREGAFIYGLGLLGVSMENAFSASVQIGVLGLIATILAGFPALFWQQDGANIFKLKHSKE